MTSKLCWGRKKSLDSGSERYHIITMSVALRPYQTKSVKDIFAAWKKHRRVLYTLPTGGGKTVVGVTVIRRVLAKGKRVLVLAHRKELLNQMWSTLERNGVPETDLGIIRADDPRTNPMAAVQIASVDTLRSRKKPQADVVVIDEAHRSEANTYVEIMKMYPKALVLGLTATPRREDGKTLQDSYDVLVKGPGAGELSANGDILSPRIYTKVGDMNSVNLKDLGKAKGDWIAKALSSRINTKQQRGCIVQHVQERAKGRTTVVFACDVVHATAIWKDLKKAKLKAELLLGSTPPEEREAIVGSDKVEGRLETGETQIIVTVAVVNEGFDVPRIKCAVMARPTKSLTLYLQQCGRILRPWKDPKTGKTVTPVILDHYGIVLREGFGFPDVDRNWSLEDSESNGGATKSAPEKSCTSCGRVQPAATSTCPDCGFSFAKEREKLEMEMIRLQEITKAQLEGAKEKERQRIYKTVAELGKPKELADKIVELKKLSAA